jgi:predicted chitinase
MQITRSQVGQLAPQAKAPYVASLTSDSAPATLDRFGIVSPLRLAHFMAQILHESGALTVLAESLRYTHAERIMEVWPTRFPTKEAAAPFVRNPRALANRVYGGRMGNTDPADGWRYIGRGLLQITGREAYTRYGNILRIALAASPDLAFSADWALAVAAVEWQASGCNQAADADDLDRVTRLVNGGDVGAGDRRAWLLKTKAVYLQGAAS